MEGYEGRIYSTYCFTSVLDIIVAEMGVYLRRPGAHSSPEGACHLSAFSSLQSLLAHGRSLSLARET